jgi:cytochrome b561
MVKAENGLSKTYHQLLIDNMVEELVINQFFFMVHRVGCIALAGSVIIHIIAACYHHYVRKNNLFDRMTKSNKSLKIM